MKVILLLIYYDCKWGNSANSLLGCRYVKKTASGISDLLQPITGFAAELCGCAVVTSYTQESFLQYQRNEKMF
jgi:hypothetical protein